MHDDALDIKAGHRSLSSLARTLERAKAPRARYTALHELAALLVRHFRQEERHGGFFDSVCAAVPSHKGVVRQLRKAHEQMLEDVRWLCSNCDSHTQLSRDAQKRLTELLSELEDHEAVERRILHDAVTARESGGTPTQPPPEVASSTPPSDRVPTSTGNRLSDAATLRGEDDAGALEDVVSPEHLSVVFQPIVDMLTGDAFAHEVLVRCDIPGMTPPVLFERAAAKNCTGILGRLIRDIALSASDDERLFVNIHPQELSQEWLVRPDDPVYTSTSDVYLEITESAPLTHHDLCMDVLKDVASRVGIYVVIDDLGAGYSNLLRIANLEPAVVKLDRSLVMGIDKHARQRRLVESVVQMCTNLGAEVVAEGVETADEYLALLETGVHYAQGYLFARPAFPIPKVLWPPL